MAGQVKKERGEGILIPSPPAWPLLVEEAVFFWIEPLYSDFQFPDFSPPRYLLKETQADHFGEFPSYFKGSFRFVE